MSQKEVQNAIEQSEEVIDEAGEFISGCHEYQTRYALVDPILTSLGWDISDVNQVEVEYDTDWGRVDYALLKNPDGELAIAVEAKALWTNLAATSIQRQILSYAEGRKKGYLNQYQGGICISGRLTMTERTPRDLISPLGPNWVGTDSAV